MKITLNLATKPYADQGPALKRLRIGMAVLAVILLGLGWGLYHIHNKAEAMRAQEADLDRKIARVQQEELGYQAQMREPANARVLTQAVFLNHLFDEKSFSWTAAMEDLERVLPAGVQVTAIEPVRGKDGRLTLRLRISGQRERSVEMVRNMERSRRFVAPRISGENADTDSSQNNVQQVRDVGKVTFDLLAEYNPATLEERKKEIAAQKLKRAQPTAPAVSNRSQPGFVRPQYVPPNVPRPGFAPGLAPTRPGMPMRQPLPGRGSGQPPQPVGAGAGMGGPQ